jgi:peptidoglycan/xylan/chitin deacetylase (PgdA/CDA1 family)
MRLYLGSALAPLLVLAACTHGPVDTKPDAAGAVTRTPPTAVAPTTTAVVSVPPTLPGAPVAAGSRATPKVALTFDSNLTAAMVAQLDSHRVASFDNTAVIDELQQLKVPATFFLAGLWMERYPDEVRRLAADPLFELGSHSYAHRPFVAPCFGLGRALPVADMAADVQHSFELLKTFTDRPVPYFRFPGGCYDQAALDGIASTGVTVIQYDVASGDAFGLSVKGIVQHVLGSVQNGSIVVMHITGGTTSPLTAKALPDVVAGLRAKGFTLVKVSDLLAAGDVQRAGPTGSSGGVSASKRRVEPRGEPHRTSRPPG